MIDWIAGRLMSIGGAAVLLTAVWIMVQDYRAAKEARK